jgi:rfaE bifunctional protein kinase chain/domain
MDFSSVSLIVVGDVMLDRYWVGDATRISPEAPVPVVLVESTRDVAGGAGNVAANAANLGAATTLLSVVGDDDNGRTLQALLETGGVQCRFLRDRSLPTTVKLRVLARNQQIVRIDFERRPNHELMFPVVDLFRTALETSRMVIFSDYGKGGLAHVAQMCPLARASGATVLVDPKVVDYSIYRGANVITPNRREFADVVGMWDSEAEFERRGFALRDELALDSLLVTRSEEGMSLFLETRHVRIPAHAREVFDVSGAGDTVIATLAVALGAGYDMEQAARLANIAAGIVVSKVGTSPITLEELGRYV